MSRRRADRSTEVELPAAYCRICGAGVREGQGRTLPGIQAVVRLNPFGRAFAGETWLRSHDRCADLDLGTLLGKLIGIEGVTVEQARRALSLADVATPTAVARDIDVEAASTRPFGFVTPGERKSLREAIETVRANERSAGPKRNARGGCGLCGRARSLRWWSATDNGLHRTRWLLFRDGSPAPMCDDSHGHWRDAGRPRDLDPLRARFEAVMAGMQPQLGARSIGLKFFSEVADDHTGTAEPWTYSAALPVLRQRLQEAHPATILDPFDREHELKMVAVKRARAARELAEQQAREAPGADLPWTG